MSRPLSEDLRMRLVAAVDGGMSRRAAADRFGVAASTAIKWVRQWRREGHVRARSMGRPARFKLDGYEEEILSLVEAHKDIALHEIADHLAQAHGVKVAPSTVCLFFKRRGLTFKKRQAMHRNSKDPMCSPAAGSGSTGSPTLTRSG